MTEYTTQLVETPIRQHPKMKRAMPRKKKNRGGRRRRIRLECMGITHFYTSLIKHSNPQIEVTIQ